jgi:hypothetical protein
MVGSFIRWLRASTLGLRGTDFETGLAQQNAPKDQNNEAISPADYGTVRRKSSRRGLANWIQAANVGKPGEVGKRQPEASEAELELARLERELAEVRIERDLPKNLRRTSRRSRGEVPWHGGIAAPVSTAADVPVAGRVSQRVLRLAPPAVSLI